MWRGGAGEEETFGHLAEGLLPLPRAALGGQFVFHEDGFSGDYLGWPVVAQEPGEPLQEYHSGLQNRQSFKKSNSAKKKSTKD